MVASLASVVDGHRAALQGRDQAARYRGFTDTINALRREVAGHEQTLRDELATLHVEHRRLDGLAETVMNDADQALRAALVDDFFRVVSPLAKHFREEPSRAIARQIGTHLQAFEQRAHTEIGLRPTEGHFPAMALAYAFSDALLDDYHGSEGFLSAPDGQVFGRALMMSWRAAGDAALLEQALADLESALVDIARRGVSSSADEAMRRREAQRYKVARLCDGKALAAYDATPPEPVVEEPRSFMKGFTASVFGGA